MIDLLGQGTFGQVVKCERVSTGELFSVKVIKNKSAYKTQSCMEIEILKKVNPSYIYIYIYMYMYIYKLRWFTFNQYQ